MSIEKQIEEMARITCNANNGGMCDITLLPCDTDCGIAKAMAEQWG